MSQRCACQGLQELDLQPAERAACNVDAAEEQQAVHELLCREQRLRSLKLPCYSRMAPLPSSIGSGCCSLLRYRAACAA